MSLILFNHRCHQTFGFQPPFAQQKVTEELWSGRSYFVCPRSRRKSAIHFSYTRLNSQTSNHCSLTCVFHRFTFKFCISFAAMALVFFFAMTKWQTKRDFPKNKTKTIKAESHRLLQHLRECRVSMATTIEIHWKKNLKWEHRTLLMPTIYHELGKDVPSIRFLTLQAHAKL